MTHYRNYAIFINSIQSGKTISIEALSNDYISKEKQNCKSDLIKNNLAKISDDISFKFKYSYT